MTVRRKPVKPQKIVETVKRGIRQRKSGQKPDAAQSSQSSIPDKQKILLRGLEVLGENYASGGGQEDFYDKLKFFESEAAYQAEALGKNKKNNTAVLDTVNQYRTVDAIIEKYPDKRSALIQILLDIQHEFNWVPKHIINWVALKLAIPASKIYTVANFYEVLSLEPMGEHIIQICEGTACHVRGSAELKQRIAALLGIQPGQTDKDMVFTFKEVHCLGCCALAPVIKIDEQYYSNPSMDDLKRIFDTYWNKKEIEACHE